MATSLTNWREPGFMDALNLERTSNYVRRSNAHDAPNAYQSVNSPTSAPAPSPTPSSSNSAFNAFYQTPLYQFPLQQGLDAVNANYAARGMLQSGAAQKAISDYSAGMASGGLRDYFSLLGNQQAIGFNAASGQVGASQNYANSITGANNNYSNSLQNINTNLANAQSQGALNTGNIYANQAYQNANNSNSMIGGIGSALGSAAGYFAYQPYAGGTPTSGWGTPGIY